MIGGAARLAARMVECMYAKMAVFPTGARETEATTHGCIGRHKREVGVFQGQKMQQRKFRLIVKALFLPNDWWDGRKRDLSCDLKFFCG